MSNEKTSNDRTSNDKVYNDRIYTDKIYTGKKRGSSTFSWFLAGLGLGSLLGVLYAPKPGQETREDLIASALGSTDYLKQRSQEATRAAGDYVEQGKEQASNYVAAGKEQLDQYVSRGKDVVETGRQKINEVYNQGVQVVAEKKEKLSAAIDAGKQAYVETPAPELPKEELIPGSKASS